MALSTRRRSMGLRPRPFGGGSNLTRIRHCSSVTSLGYCALVSIATAPSLECQNSRGRSFFYRFRQFQNAFLDGDVYPTVSIGDVSAHEGDGQVSFTLFLSQSSTQ